MAQRHASILLTRPAADAERFATLLRARGVVAEIEISPIVEIVPTGVEVDLTGLGGVIFTSRNAIAFAEPLDVPAWCVGEATAEAATGKGWRAIAANGDAEALYARILADAPKGQLLHLRGALSRGGLAERLTAEGILTSEAIIYRQKPLALTDQAKAWLMGNSPVIVPLFSPNAGVQFAQQIDELGADTAPLWGVAISEATQEVLGNAICEKIVLAEKKEANAMANAITRLLDTV